MDDVHVPAVSAFGGFGPVGGLGWLDTEGGQVRPPDEDAELRWLIQEADGSTLCVCLRHVAGAPPLYELRTYGPSGEAIETVALRDWPTTFVARTETDTAIDPTGRFLYVAWARETAPERWTIGLDLVSRDEGTSRTTDLADVKTMHTLGSPVDVRLWLAPDARHARIDFAASDGLRLSAPADGGWWAWNVPIDARMPGEATRVREPGMPAGTGCFAEGWATPRDFVEACEGPDRRVVTVRSISLDGTVGHLELAKAEELSWLISQSTGQLFLWASVDRHLWRIDIPSLDVAEREFSPDDIDVASGSAWPLPGEDGVAWQPRGWQLRPPWLDERDLVGSHDGTVLYALGYRELGPSESTGVWVMDANSLALVDHWAAIGSETTVALTPRGDHVIAAGGPSAQELAAGGSHGATVTFHDARGAGISLILRGVTTWPTFLVSEPPPKPT
jgi:hypothetical protein